MKSFVSSSQLSCCLIVGIFSLGCSSGSDGDDLNGQGGSGSDSAPTFGSGSATNIGSVGEGTGGSPSTGGSTGLPGTGGMGTGGMGTGGATTAPPPDAIPCPLGSKIEKASTGSYYSWPGTVFSNAVLTGQGENHSPKRLEVKVTDGAGEPVSDCEVRFETEEGQGWGFLAQPTTDTSGNVYGYWTAGAPGENTLSAVIQLEGGGESRVDFKGAVTDHSTRTDSVHINYDVNGAYSEFKIQITPVTQAAATYYSALNWKDSYAGIQFDGDRTLVLFSVWDAGGQDATIDSAGACNATVGFGGEGTGTSCRFVFPPSTHGAVTGLPNDYMLKVGDTYELHLVTGSAAGGRTQNTMTFTDVTRGFGPISLGTQSTGGTFTGGGYASGFVEEWTPHGSCLSNTRAVYYHDISYKVASAAWQNVTGATFSPNYVKANNEICGNYLSQVVDGKFFVSSGGSEYVGRPHVPGDALFPRSQPKMTLP